MRSCSFQLYTEVKEGFPMIDPCPNIYGGIYSGNLTLQSDVGISAHYVFLRGAPPLTREWEN